VTEQNTINSGTVRHVLVIGALELEVEDGFVFQQEHQIGAPLQVLAKSTFRNALIRMPPVN
jgi:hypothetical protein